MYTMCINWNQIAGKSSGGHGSHSSSESHRTRHSDDHYSRDRRALSPGYYHERERGERHDGYESRTHYHAPSLEDHYSSSQSSHSISIGSGRSSSANYRSYESDRRDAGYSRGRKLFVRNVSESIYWCYTQFFQVHSQIWYVCCRAKFYIIIMSCKFMS